MRSLFHTQRLLLAHADEDSLGTIPASTRSNIPTLDDNPHPTSIIGNIHDKKEEKEAGNDGYYSKFNLSNGGCIGVDVGPQIIESAKRKYPHVPFVVGDAWKMSDLIQMKETIMNRGGRDRQDTNVEMERRHGYDHAQIERK